MFDASNENCAMCGGDGRIGNAFGDTKVCPGCRGSGRRSEDTGFRDVTKTKPSHHARGTPGAGAKVVAKETGPKWPLTEEGAKLATEVRDSDSISGETKTQLIQEIIAYETSHGSCTLTFSRKIRKQLRARA